MKRVLSCILAALMILCLTCGAFAAIKVVSPGEDFYYLDTANVLKDSTKGEIYFCNTQLYEECGAQICIVALNTINGASTEDYALEMATKWGIGSEEKNNGFLLLMAIKEDDYYAIAGNGLQKILPASVIKDYYDKYLETDFAAKDYDAGARKFFEAVFNKVVDYYNLALTVEDGVKAYEAYAADSSVPVTYGGAEGAGGRATGGNSNSGYDYEEYDPFKLVLGAIILIWILWMIFKPRRYRSYRPYGGPHYGPGPGPGPHGPFGGPRRPGGFGGGGHSSFGGGHSSFGGGHSSFGSGGHSSFGGSGRSGSFGSSSSSRSSFGGGRSGGGGGFGGGAGRGRH